MKFGIDVSSNNGTIDWNKVKAEGVEFVIIRCGFGSDFKSQDDSQFERNYNECKRLGIPVGTYLYSYACNVNDAKSEVNHVTRLINGKNFELGIWIDMEDADGYKAKHGVSYNTCVDICETFCGMIENKGLMTGIYANLDWLNNKINNSRLDRFKKWVAQWTTQCTFNKPYVMWQFGGETNLIRKNKLNGINGSVDMDYLVDESILPQPTPTPEPSPTPQPDYTGTITYQAFTNRWLPEVHKCDGTPDGYAGIGNEFITGFRCKPQYGEIIYEAHALNGAWLGEVNSRDYKTNDTNNGLSYAGIYGTPIDAIRIKSTRGFVKYRVKTAKRGWLPWVIQYEDYAGNFGEPIIGLQMK